MSRDAQLYILDEPIGGVDPAARDYILRMILKNYNEDATLLISTHLITDIENILDRVLFIQNGQLALNASVDEIRTDRGNLWTACSGRCSNVKKLIKYDLKYGAKIFIVIHALLWIAAIFGRVFFLDRIDFDAPTEQLVSVLVLFFSAFVLLFSVVSLATALLIAARFYKNLFTDEGYLTWTLPASPVQQLWAKILSGCIWNILDLILLYSATYFMWISPNVQNAYRMIAAEFTASLGMPLSKFFPADGPVIHHRRRQQCVDALCQYFHRSAFSGASAFTQRDRLLYFLHDHLRTQHGRAYHLQAAARNCLVRKYGQ